MNYTDCVKLAHVQTMCTKLSLSSLPSIPHNSSERAWGQATMHMYIEVYVRLLVAALHVGMTGKQDGGYSQLA